MFSLLHHSTDTARDLILYVFTFNTTEQRAIIQRIIERIKSVIFATMRYIN